MKALITLILVTFGFVSSIAQPNQIETQSVAINDIINFVAEKYEYQEENSTDINNITFALQVSGNNISTENFVILKQAFKLLSERLNDQNSVSIVTYFGFNGVALKQTSPKSLDSINNVLKNLKESVDDFHKDGIELAYQYAGSNFDENSTNTIIIVRNTNATKPDATSMTEQEIKKIKRKKRNKAILTTAVALLPELIALLDK